MNTHLCSVPGCGRSLPPNLLMCGRHWRSVPRGIQAAVYAAWHQYERGEIGIAELRAAQQPATDAAAAAAKGGVS